MASAPPLITNFDVHHHQIRGIIHPSTFLLDNICPKFPPNHCILVTFQGRSLAQIRGGGGQCLLSKYQVAIPVLILGIINLNKFKGPPLPPPPRRLRPCLQTQSQPQRHTHSCSTIINSTGSYAFLSTLTVTARTLSNGPFTLRPIPKPLPTQKCFSSPQEKIDKY